MYKLKRIVFYIMLLALIIKTNECYGMKTNENKGGEKTVMERIKALPYSKIFICGNKLFFSLAHSIINNFYELETLEMNKVYSLKKYLCLGYRLQPTFLAPFSFLDFNVNILGVVLDMFIPFCLGGLSHTSLSFYFITSLFNINLCVRITKDFYIPINIVGLMRAIFMPFLIKNDRKKIEEIIQVLNDKYLVLMFWNKKAVEKIIVDNNFDYEKIKANVVEKITNVDNN